MRKSRPVLAMLLGLAAACSRPQVKAVGPQQSLYVTLPEAHAVAIFQAGAAGDAQPIATIRESATDTPVDASVSLRGEVFIGNSNGSVKVYAAQKHQYTLVRTIAGDHTAMVHPVAMAVDPTGNIFVADTGGGPGKAKIVRLAAANSGNIYPERVISGPHTGLASPSGIALDASGQVYITDRASGRILIFAADARGDAAPVATIEGFKGPRRVFMDQDLNLYVSCGGDDTIVVLAPDGPLRWTRLATISSPAMRSPDGVAADSSGQIAAAVPGAVLYFAPGANGSTTPINRLEGPAPMNPTGLMIR